MLGIAAGGTMILFSLFLIVRQTQAYQTGRGYAGQAARVGVTAAAPEAAPFLARTGAERSALTRQQTQRERITATQQQRGQQGTRTTVTRTQQGDKTIYTTTKEQLRSEAGKYVPQRG
jgi:hypothetical protein